MAELVFMRDQEVSLRLRLEGPITVGRGVECDLQVPDKAVSRRQFRVSPLKNGWQLEDLSERGTRVSRRLADEDPVVLRDGDTIPLGELEAVFTVRDTTVESAQGLTDPGPRRGGTAKLRETSLLRRAELRILRPEGESVVPLRADEGYKVTLGRDPTGNVQVVFDDPLVSANHVRIQVRDGKWVLRDLDSKNGTWVDGVRVTECFLGERSHLRFGESQAWFVREGGGTDDTPQPVPGLVTRDPSMAGVVDAVRRYAPAKVAVSIRGETGSGKEVVAQALHRLSGRVERPFVAINCGALPREMLESELFGHEKGAFTGADRTKVGAFEEAHEGTLFLDEIGDLPTEAQVKLLRVLETGEVRRLGGSGARKVDVRVVCATHRDLAQLVEDGGFREDLYYRLCVAIIELPPLRQRRADVVPIAHHFIAKLAPGQTVTLSAAAKARLETHPWHGNARELRNVIQTALLHRRGNVVDEEDLIFRAAPRKQRVPTSIRVAGLTMEQIEREAYRLALERHNGDRRLVMEELGVSRATMFRRLADFGLE